MSSNKNTVRVDWKAPHGILTGTLNATAGTLVTTALAHSAGMPSGYALAAGAAGAVGSSVAGWRNRLTGATVAFRAACWTAAGTWSCWALSSAGPMTLTGLGSLLVGSIATGTLAAGFAAREETEQARRRMLLSIGTRRALAAEWIERIARVCRVEDVSVLGIEHWPSGMGYTVEIELPEGGVTRKQVADRTDALASDLDLPDGCGLQVLPGISRRRLLIEVATKTYQGQEIPFPVEEMTETTTINNPAPIALLSDGGRAELDMRQASTVVAGGTGTGKTNWLQTLIARLLQTNDTLVWVIDLNAGSLGLPWLHAWREAQKDPARRDEVPAPGVDWLASTPAEAKLMLDAAIAIASARKIAYQQHMRDEDDDKLPVSPQIPEIVIIMDESAEVSATKAAKEVMAGVVKVIRVARAMAIRAVISALRVTQDVLPDPMVRKMASNRVCTGANEDSELGHLFGWRALTAENSFSGPGSMLVGTEGKQPKTAQQWRITPSGIDAVTRATAHRRPTLDTVSLQAAGPAYTDRWSEARCGHLWGQPVATGAPAVPGSGVLPGRPGGQWKATAGWDQPRPVTTPGADELEALFLMPSADPETRAESDGLTDWSDPSSWTAGRPVREPEQPDARQAALDLLIAAGPVGTGASAMERDLKDTFGTRRPVIQRWLKEWADAGEIARVGEGSKARYVHRRHLPEA
ncbi:hypothetical protein ADK91_35780 [Streptomyces sp. XY511]|uniref:hypothetical protein n=1 Tax=Streptomyces sp. XY511 TaxID=1519480 RepID=UPI0006AED5DF|nr:hypothetical protein [Streptomyces sp. XY511]KOU95807.1 hypothetical protein ADK91_35780 [Streptomyces sp. XY511]